MKTEIKDLPDDVFEHLAGALVTMEVQEKTIKELKTVLDNLVNALTDNGQAHDPDTYTLIRNAENALYRLKRDEEETL